MDARDVAVTVATYVAVLTAYGLSHLVPTKPGLWVFGADGGDRFAGNPKYAYLHAAAEHADEVRPVWLSDDEDIVRILQNGGYEAYAADGLRGVYLTLRAEYVVVSHGPGDVSWWATGSADVVQTWHGVPLKRIGGDLDRDWSLPGRFFFRLNGSGWEYFVSTAERLGSIFEGAYRQSAEDILPVGYPRNDEIRDGVPGAMVGEDDAVHDRVRSLAADHPLALYMPTWRDWGSGVEQGTPLRDAVDFERLDAEMADRDAYLLVKLHPHERLDVDLGSLDRVVELPADADPYPVLRYVDVLATDYSSVYFDYLWADRPVVFFPYDRESYAENPGFYFDYDDVTPGPTPTDFEGFCDALGDALDGYDGSTDAGTAEGDAAAAAEGVPDGGDPYADERAAVRDHFFDHDGGRAGERLYRRLRREAANER